MAVKLFFKHILNGMRRRPLQPLLLVVVIAVAIIVCTLGIELKYFLVEDIELASEAKNGSANITVGVSAESKTRFLTIEDAKAVLPSGSAVCGTYELPFYYGENDDLIVGVTTDLTEIESLFQIESISSAPFDVNTLTKRQLRNCAYITQSFAEELGLQVGDTLTLKLFEEECNYTVEVIASKPLLGQYKVMVDASNIVAKLNLELLRIDPYNKLYIKTTGDVNESIACLNEVFAGYDVAMVKSNSNVAAGDMSVISTILVIVCCALSIVTIYSCFSILSAQRQEESALFYAVGAKNYMLNLAGFAEMFIYWLVGTAIGVGLCAPVSKLFASLAGYTYCEGNVIPKAPIISAAVMLASAELSMLIRVVPEKFMRHATKNKKAVSKEKTSRIIKIVIASLLLVATAVCTIIACTIDVKKKDVCGIIGVIFACLTIFYVGKLLFVDITARIGKSNKVPVCMRYAGKNCSRTNSQSNISGLIALFLAVAIAIAIPLDYTNDYIYSLKHMINADYVMMGATTDATDRMLEEVEGVDKAYGFAQFRVNVYERTANYTAICLCSGDASAYEKYGITELPKEGEVIIGRYLLGGLGLEVGDDWTFGYDGIDYTLKIIDVADINSNMIFIDVNSVGASYKYTAIKVKDGYDKEAVRGEIMDVLRDDSVVIAGEEKIMEEKTINAESYSFSITLAYICVILFAIVGIADNIGESYRSRKDEFACYAAAGMNKKTLRKMKALELLFALVIGVVVCALFIAVVMVNVYEICLTHIFNIFYFW